MSVALFVRYLALLMACANRYRFNFYAACINVFSRLRHSHVLKILANHDFQFGEEVSLLSRMHCRATHNRNGSLRPDLTTSCSMNITQIPMRWKQCGMKAGKKFVERIALLLRACLRAGVPITQRNIAEKGLCSSPLLL